jgi:hypothetical protein
MVTLESLNLQKLAPEQLGELLIEAKKAYYTISTHYCLASAKKVLFISSQYQILHLLVPLTQHS